WFNRYGRPFTYGWPDDAIWPYFAKHRAVLDEAMQPKTRFAGNVWFSRERVFDVLATFPQPPADLVPQLLELALGSAKTDRMAAQRVLERLSSKEDHIIDALASGKAEQRIAAAQWLTRLKYADAVPALETALAKEKNDAAAGALMSALEALGAPVDRFIDRQKLAKDAEKGLAKSV